MTTRDARHFLATQPRLLALEPVGKMWEVRIQHADDDGVLLLRGRYANVVCMAASYIRETAVEARS